MRMDTDALLHPERLRILMEFAGGGGRTAADLQRTLEDVSPATLYRHLGLLSGAGFLSVRETRRVRGAEEKIYQLAVSPLLSMDEVAKDPALFLKVATTFAALVLGDFTRYASRIRGRKTDPLLRAYALDLTDAEFRETSEALAKVLARAAKKAAGRRRRTLAARDRQPRRFYLGALPEVTPA
jgi:DNA-binding transcriptional ArsR family regulator